MKSISFCAIAAGILFLIPILSSCGGNTSNGAQPGATTPVATSGPGQTTISVAWPQPTDNGRVVPFAARSVRVRIFNSANVQVAEQLLVRPVSEWWLTPTTATITGLPVDTLRVVAEAFPESNGSGTVQARGATGTTVAAGDNPPLRLRLDSTVTSLTASALVVGVGKDTPFTVTARNAEGEIVLESPDAYTSLTSSNPAVAIPLPGFLVRGYAAGKTTFTLHNNEAQKDVSFEVQTFRTAQYRVAEVTTDWTSKFDVCLPTAINKNGSFVGYCYSGRIKPPHTVVGFVADPNPSSATEPYTVKQLPTIEDYSQIYPLDINDRGYIVGQAYNGINKAIGFVRPPDLEGLRDIGSLGGNYTLATSVSNDAANTVVGASQSSDGNMYAIRFVNGSISRLDATASWSEVYETNDKGGIAGARFEKSFFFANFWDASGGQARSELARHVYACSINNHGQMVGFAAQQHDVEDGPAYPLFWSSRFKTSVRGEAPTFWGDNVRALGINDNGLIVGTASTAFSATVKSRAVCWINNRPNEFNNMIPTGTGWDLKSATALNNNGCVVGVGSRSGGPDHLYVLIPQDPRGGLQVGVD